VNLAATSASAALAREVNPATIEAQAAHIRSLESQLAVLRLLLKRDSSWIEAVVEWLAQDEEQLVVETDAGPATVHSLLESGQFRALGEAARRIIDGELPRYICGHCDDVRCGGRVKCVRATDQDSGLVTWTKMPLRVRNAFDAMVKAQRASARLQKTEATNA
jgi:hypothetical protein